MSKLNIDVKDLQLIKEALAAAQDELNVASEKKASDEAQHTEISAHAKAAAQVLCANGLLQPKFQEGWVSRVSGPEGHKIALEAVTKMAAERPKVGKLGRSTRVNEASEKRSADQKFLDRLGF